MSKLTDRKNWLSAADAARDISNQIREDVTEADVLRFALDGHLKLSVYFVNGNMARCGKVIKLEPNDNPRHWDGPSRISKDGVKYITRLEEEVVAISGLFDLEMGGGVSMSIEKKYQQLTGGPAEAIQGGDLIYVNGDNGLTYEIQESFDRDECTSGSSAELKMLKQRIADNQIAVAEAKILLNKHEKERNEFLERRLSQSDLENYYPAGRLPDDALLVVRTEVLEEFEKSMNGTPPAQDKPLQEIERKTLLTIIAALCDDNGIDFRERGATKRIADLTEIIGAPISEDTVLRHLKKIPDVLKSRMK
jgi:hypothetical protein